MRKSPQLSTSLIEKQAIGFLKQVLLDTQVIDPHIAENDTQISWDGELIIYESVEKFGTKDSLGRIPFQVKGTTNPKFSNGLLKHRVSLQDLKNYRQDGGCIYFVVCVTQPIPCIYYALFLPYDLEKLLFGTIDKAPKNSKITLYLQPFPKESSVVTALMHLFISDQPKQVSTAKYSFDMLNPDEKGKKVILDSLNNEIGAFSYTLYGSSDKPFGDSFDIPTYFYANTSIGLQIPVQRIHMDSISIGGVPYIVCVNDIKYLEQVTLTNTKDKESITIGNSLTIDLPRTREKIDTSINFTEKGTLSERIHDTEFWLSICTKKECHIVCESLFDGIISKEHPVEYIELLSNRLDRLKNIKRTLDYFKVNDDLNYDKLTDKELEDLDILLRASRGNELSVNITNYAPISFVVIANLYICVYIEKLDNDKYKIDTIANMTKIGCRFTINDDECDASPYLLFRKINLIRCSNIDYVNMFDSCFC